MYTKQKLQFFCLGVKIKKDEYKNIFIIETIYMNSQNLNEVARIPGGNIKRKLRIGTWNVRILYEYSTKSENNRLKRGILRVSET